MSEYIYFYVGGLLAGTAGTLISQPFDICKIYLQTGHKLDIRNRTFVQNIQWAYKGMTPSIVGYSIEKCLIFGTYTSTYKYLSNSNYNNESILRTSLSGFVSGLVASLSIAPFEQIKTDKQLGNKTEVNCKYLYKGLKYTAMRESIGFSIYFSVYEKARKHFSSENDGFYLNLFKSGIYGAFSAFIAWIPIYPIDTNKTRIQSGGQFDNFVHELKSHNGGYNKFKFLYKGYHFAMMRAIPFHSTCFVCYEIMKHYYN
jgi:solute carrier family 25 carnitine/acylcarnitine transporter 20/29